MMGRAIEAYTEDIKRVVSTTPTVDITGQTVLAKVYKDEEYQGVANTVRPDPETASAVLNITNSGAGNENVTVTILTKYRHEDNYTQLKQEVLTVPVGTDDFEVNYDQEDKEDVNVQVSAIGVNCVVNSIKAQQSQFNDLQDLVVGGAADEEVAIPCDFRRFEPGDDYTIVFVASNYGVIGRSIMVLYGNDGYSTEADES